MKEAKVKLYSFDELSDDVRKRMAQDAAFDVMYYVMEGHDIEWKASLRHFEQKTGFNAKNWEVGYYTSHFSFSDPAGSVLESDYEPIYAEDCKGKLLFRWCNKFITRNRRGKYYGKLVSHPKDAQHPVGLRHVLRHSKVIAEPITGGWCPWTGCITDCSLVEPIVDFYLNYHRGKFSEDYSLEDLISDCLDKFFSEWESEYNAWGNNEGGCVEEELSARYEDELFYEDGTKFDGIYEEAV